MRAFALLFIFGLSLNAQTFIEVTPAPIPDYNTCSAHDVMAQKALDSADEWMDIAEVGAGEGTDVAEKRAEAAEKVYKYHHKNYLNCLEGAR